MIPSRDTPRCRPISEQAMTRLLSRRRRARPDALDILSVAAVLFVIVADIFFVLGALQWI